MAAKETLYTAVDIGTTKVCTLVGKVSPAGEMQVVAIGHADSEGMRKGMIVSSEELRLSVLLSVAEARGMLGRPLPPAFVGITGSHLTGVNAAASLTRQAKGGSPVSQRDVDQLLESARPELASRRRVVHVLPRTYQVDGQDGVRNPVGLAGQRLGVESHVVVGDPAPMENIARVVRSAGVRVRGLVLEHLASSEAVLSTDEREAGVVLADIGGGTTDIAIFKEGAVLHTAAVPVAGHQLTSDVALGLGIPLSTAEEMKRLYGSAVTEGMGPNDRVEVRIGDRQEVRSFSRLSLSTLLRDRAVELVRLILIKVREAGLDRMPQAGLVLTGGSANLPGLAEVARDYAGCPVRIGSPATALRLPQELQDTAFATGVGLLLWGIRHRQASPISPQVALSAPVLQRLREWVLRVSWRRPREVRA